MPASTSSKISVATAGPCPAAPKASRVASIARASSPPEATLASGSAGSPGLAPSRNAPRRRGRPRRRRPPGGRGAWPARPAGPGRPRPGAAPPHDGRRPTSAAARCDPTVGVAALGVEGGGPLVVRQQLVQPVLDRRVVGEHVGQRRDRTCAAGRAAAGVAPGARRAGRDRPPATRPQPGGRRPASGPRSSPNAAGPRARRTAARAAPAASATPSASSAPPSPASGARRRRRRLAVGLGVGQQRLLLDGERLVLLGVGRAPAPSSSSTWKRSRSTSRARARGVAAELGEGRVDGGTARPAPPRSGPRSTPPKASSAPRWVAGARSDWWACWPWRSTRAAPSSASAATVAMRPST